MSILKPEPWHTGETDFRRLREVSVGKWMQLLIDYRICSRCVFPQLFVPAPVSVLWSSFPVICKWSDQSCGFTFVRSFSKNLKNVSTWRSNETTQLQVCVCVRRANFHMLGCLSSLYQPIGFKAPQCQSSCGSGQSACCQLKGKVT